MEPNSLLFPGLQSCQGCPALAANRIQVVPGYGIWPNKVMIVGEAPGELEQRGFPRPFVGDSGQLLRAMLLNVGWDLDQLYVTNTVHCHPPGNRDPSAAEIKKCGDWLSLEIATVDPDMIICVGAKAYRHFLPDEKSSITAIRGHIFERTIGTRKRWIMPTVHPAFVMRNEHAWRPLFESDIAKAKEAVDKKSLPVLPTPFRKTAASWPELIKAVHASTKFGLDLEFDGPHDTQNFPMARKAEIVGIGVATGEGKSYYYPCPDHEDILSKINDIREPLESNDWIKVVSNVKAEKTVLHNYGIELRNYRDTLIEAWLLGWLPTMGELPKALKDAWQRVFGTEMIRIDTLIGSGKKTIGMRQATLENEDAVVEYGNQDPDASLRLHEAFYKEIVERGLEDLYLNIEMPFTDIIIQMEEAGFGFDGMALESSRETLENHIESSMSRFVERIRPEIETFSREQLETMAAFHFHKRKKLEQWEDCINYGYYDIQDKKKAELEEDFVKYSTTENLQRYVADNFNPNSHDQVRILLYGEEGASGGVLMRPRWGKLGTDKVTLAENVDNPIVKSTLEIRATKKLLGTYVTALDKHVDEDDGRIHSSISQTGTDTGRISSARPNLTNIPARKRGDIENVIDPKAIRSAFVPQNGNILACFDLSQIEMRIQAHLANVKKMKELFIDGGDVHDNTTTGIFNTTLENLIYTHGEVEGPKEWNNSRFVAKTIGFGVLYGLTAKGLMARTPELDLTYKDARDFIDAFFGIYPEIRLWQNGVRMFVRDKKWYETQLHRRRYFPEVTSNDRQMSEKALRECVNFPIQGGAADYFKLSIIDVGNELRRINAKAFMVNQVHDEVNLEAPMSELDMLGEVVPPIMSAVRHRLNMDIPVPVDYEWGYNWGELTAWKAAA